MSDKPIDRLSEPDQIIRRAWAVGMDDGTHITIEFFTGFERFNTRPYHNYETWSGGYRVRGGGITVEREDMDDAVREWARKFEEAGRPREPLLTVEARPATPEEGTDG